jgi:polar amino acid transport system substrate-binding protein
MKRRRFIALLGSSAALAATPTIRAQSFESTWERVNSTKIIRVGAVASSSPYYVQDIATGQWKGCMAEFYQGLADSLGCKLQISTTTWGNAVLDLQSNKSDLFFGLNPTPARKLVIDFTDPTLNIAYTMITQKLTGVHTWDALNSAQYTIAVDQGSSHDQLATRILTKAKIIRVETVADAAMAVQTGRADAQIIVLPLALALTKKNPAIGTMVVPTPYEYATSNGGVRKEPDQRWLQHIDAYLESERQKGNLKKIFLRNLKALSGIDPSSIPSDLNL